MIELIPTTEGKHIIVSVGPTTEEKHIIAFVGNHYHPFINLQSNNNSNTVGIGIYCSCTDQVVKGCLLLLPYSTDVSSVRLCTQETSGILKLDRGWNLNMSSGYTVSDTILGREIVLLPVFIILSRRDFILHILVE